MTHAAASTGNDQLDEIVGLIGVDAAMKLSRDLGGLEIRIPKKIGLAHPLAASIGIDNAVKLLNWATDAKIFIPKTPARHARVKQLAATRALTKQAIAQETGYTERRIYQILAEQEERDQDGQQDLFSNDR